MMIKAQLTLSVDAFLIVAAALIAKFIFPGYVWEILMLVAFLQPLVLRRVLRLAQKAVDQIQDEIRQEMEEILDLIERLIK